MPTKGRRLPTFCQICQFSPVSEDGIVWCGFPESSFHCGWRALENSKQPGLFVSPPWPSCLEVKTGAHKRGLNLREPSSYSEVSGDESSPGFVRVQEGQRSLKNPGCYWERTPRCVPFVVASCLS